MCDGVLVGQEGERGIACPIGVFNGSRRVAGTAGQAEVDCYFPNVLLQGARVYALNRGRCLRMQSLFARMRQVVEYRLANQRMAEVVSRSLFAEETSAQRFLECVKHGRRAYIRHGLKYGECEWVTEHRARVKKLVCLGTQPCDSTTDHVVHTLGNAPLTDHARIGYVATPLLKVPDHLTCEKWITASLFVYRIGDYEGRRSTAEGSNKTCDLVRRKWRQRKTPRRVQTTYLGKDDGKRMGAVDFRGSVRSHDH